MLAQSASTRRLSQRRAIVSAELALTLPLLILLLLSIAEIGLILADSLALGSVCRESVRAAALGKSTSEIRAVGLASAPPSLTLVTDDFTLECRTQTDGVWGTWSVLGDILSGSLLVNNAAEGAQVRVTLTYQHTLIAGPLIQGANQNGTITLRTSSVALHF